MNHMRLSNRDATFPVDTYYQTEKHNSGKLAMSDPAAQTVRLRAGAAEGAPLQHFHCSIRITLHVSESLALCTHRFAVWLKHHNALTRTQLGHCCQKAYKSLPVEVEHLNYTANISEYLKGHIIDRQVSLKYVQRI